MLHTTTAESAIPRSDVGTSTEKNEERSLLRLFIVFIMVGFVVGTLLPVYFASTTTSIGQILGSAFAFGSVGASAGLLAAGCYDVIFHGRLEE